MSRSLNLTIEETITNLNNNIETLTENLSQMDVDSKVAELTSLLPSLKNKVDEILKMYTTIYRQYITCVTLLVNVLVFFLGGHLRRCVPVFVTVNLFIEPTS